MRKIVCVITLFIAAVGFTQNSSTQYMVSTADHVFLNLTSFNHLELISKEIDSIMVSCVNCNEFTKPKMIEENDLVTIEVVVDKENIFGAQRNKYRSGDPLFADYKLILPKNKELKIRYDKGDVSANNFHGNVEMHLNHGKLLIQNMVGDLTISSYSGVIDCSLEGGKITIENSKGMIVNNLKMAQLQKNDTGLEGTIGHKDHKVTIKTVQAKVILNPANPQ